MTKLSPNPGEDVVDIPLHSSIDRFAAEPELIKRAMQWNIDLREVDGFELGSKAFGDELRDASVDQQAPLAWPDLGELMPPMDGE